MYLYIEYINAQVMKATIKENNYNATKFNSDNIYSHTYSPQGIILDLKKFKYLQWVDVPNSNLIRIIGFNKYLTYLNCEMNQIMTLDDLPENISFLNCSFNKKIFIGNLPNKLKKIICKNCSLVNLINLPTNLEYLDCSSNEMCDLSNLPFNLRELICSDTCNVSSLNYLPESIKYLTVKFNFSECKNKFKIDLSDLPIGLENFRYEFAENIQYDVSKWNVYDDKNNFKVFVKKHIYKQNTTPFLPTICNYTSNVCSDCNYANYYCICLSD